MTEEEIGVLRSLCGVDHKVFQPAGRTEAAYRRFDELVASLHRLRQAGWVELEISEVERRKVGTYRRKYRAVAARRTEQGRDALRLLGEA